MAKWDKKASYAKEANWKINVTTTTRILQKIMTTTFNHNPKRDMIITGVIIALLLYFFTSCNTLKKAENKVLENPQSVDKIGKKWALLNPCVNDTSIVKGEPVLIKGKDNIFPVYIPYPVYKIKGIDTTIQGSRIKIDTLGNVNIDLKSPTPDTVKVPTNNYITDKRRLKIVTDSLNEIIQHKADSLYGLNMELSDTKWKVNQLTDEHNNIGKMLLYALLALLKKWWFWVLVVGFLGYKFRGGLIPFITRLFK